MVSPMLRSRAKNILERYFLITYSFRFLFRFYRIIFFIIFFSSNFFFFNLKVKENIENQIYSDRSEKHLGGMN